MFGKISPEEFKQLRSVINSSSDDDLQSAMETLWDDARIHVPVPADSNYRVIEALGQHTHRKSYRLNWLKVASIILFPLSFSWATYSYFTHNKTELPDMIVMAHSGQKTHIILPDGSKVWLNSLSTLSYPSDFGIKNRTVRLKGEGYFEVTKDEKKTFNVETEGVNIVVHGTKFNITSHSDIPETRISLIEGNISVENTEHQLLTMLKPNQTLKVDKSTMQFELKEEDTSLSALWSQNKCRIEDASAEEMFQRIGYWYGLNIHLENSNKEHRYGFTIKEESFRELLELINELTPLEYSINGEEVNIRYK